MALIPEHEKFHALGPIDTIKSGGERVMGIQIARQTNATGEQIVMECPVYNTDTRDELNARLQMCYSLLQDRLEDENKAMLALEEKAKAKKAAAEAEEEARKEEKHQTELRRIEERNARKKGMSLVETQPEA
jgi:hypothetical protein